MKKSNFCSQILQFLNYLANDDFQRVSMDFEGHREHKQFWNQKSAAIVYRSSKNLVFYFQGLLCHMVFSYFKTWDYIPYKDACIRMLHNFNAMVLLLTDTILH